MAEDPLLSVRDLEKHYPIRRGLLGRQTAVARAVDGVSFDVRRGETLGLVGESGCGKTTLARSLVRLEEPTAGEVLFSGGDRRGAGRNEDGTHPNDVTRFDGGELTAFRRHVQMIFQDPNSSFDPRATVGRSVAEPLAVHGMTDRDDRRAVVEDLFDRVGLSAMDYDRYPHEFSGGQKQRIALARALVLNPDLIIADEPVSALDVSVQAEVLSLLEDLKAEFDLSLLFISHDMSVVRQVADRVAVMYLGELVEVGPTETVFASPEHPYTEALVSAIPTPDPRSRMAGIELDGEVPSPRDPPAGCRFHTRCHRVIPPEDSTLSQSTWRTVLHFRHSVAAGQVDVEALRDTAAGTGEDALRSHLRSEFDLPAELPGDAEEPLSRAVDRLLAGDEAGAVSLLGEAFGTPCERTNPAFTDHGVDHRSACLRHGLEDVAAPPGGTDDDVATPSGGTDDGSRPGADGTGE